MALSTMSEFLEGLHQSRLLNHSQVEELLHQPATSAGDLHALSRFVQDRGWMTAFQVDEILAGRARGILLGGYRLLDRLPARPGATRGEESFRVFHPALQRPVTLTLLAAEGDLPPEVRERFLADAQQVSLVQHAHLVHLLDAGVIDGRPFLLEEFPDGTDLQTLLSEMGAVPAAVGLDFLRQAALGVMALHERNLCHGRLHLGQLQLAPVTQAPRPGGGVSVRPSPGATLRVRGAGTYPPRPPLSEAADGQSEAGLCDYLPPEALRQSHAGVRGDLYGLGACLYALLAARPPHQSRNPQEARWNLEHGQVTPIQALRPDLPAGLPELLGSLLARDPADRPASVFELLTRLRQVASGSAAAATVAVAPPVAAVEPIPQAMETFTAPSRLQEIVREQNARPVNPLPAFTPRMPQPLVEPLDSNTHLVEYTPPAPQTAPAPEEPNLFGDELHGSPSSSSRPARRRKAKKPLPWGWIVMGALLHGTGVILLIGLFSGWFSGDGGPTVKPEDQPIKAEPIKPADKKKAK